MISSMRRPEGPFDDKGQGPGACSIGLRLNQMLSRTQMCYCHYETSSDLATGRHNGRKGPPVFGQIYLWLTNFVSLRYQFQILSLKQIILRRDFPGLLIARRSI